MGLYRCSKRAFDFTFWCMLATSWHAKASSLSCNETSEQYSLVKMERSAWLEIVNSSGVTMPPSALVELENPLLIAGIVGSVAVAGVAAAAVMALGAVALTVGLLWYFGVFNSHHDRRRKYDSNPSCESTDPLDTNDPDCFTIRWNKISWYYPHHNALHRGQRLIVTGEGEIETVLEQISDKAQHNQDRLVGHGGTMWRPSKTEGVYHDIWLNGAGTDHLVYAEDNIVGSLYDSESVMGEEAESDYQKLKQRLEKAREALVNDAEAMLSTQEQSVAGNSDRMTGQATTVLKDSMEDMLARQSDAAYRFVDVGRQLRASSADSIRTQSALSKKMENVGTAMVNVEDRISNSFQDVQSLTESQLTSSVRELQNLAEGKQRIFSDQVGLLLSDLSSKSIDQVMINRDIWTNVSRNSTNEIKKLADSADVTVQQASRNLSELISNESDALNRALDAGQTGQLEKGRHRDQTLAAIGTGGSMMSQQVVSETESTKLEADEVIRSIDAQVLNLISQTKHDIGSSGPEGLGSLLRTVGNVQAVSATRISKSKIDYDGSITSVLRSLGENGLDTSESVRDLYGALTNVDRSTLTGIDEAKVAGAKLLRRLQSLSFPQAVKNNASIGTHSDEVRRVVESLRTDASGVRSSIKGNQTLDFGNVVSATGAASAVSRKLLQAMQIFTYPGLKNNVPLGGASQIAALASLLAGNDDSIASSLDTEINRSITHLNVSAALNGVDQKRFLQSVVDQLENKRGSPVSGGSISTLMELLGAMSEQTSGMVSETEQTTRDSDKWRSAINSQIGGRLTNLGISDTNSLKFLTSALRNVNTDDSKSDQAISQFIFDMFRDERNQLQPKSDSTMMYHTIDRNTESLGQIKSVLEAMSLEPDIGVARIETSLVDTEASVGKRLERLSNSLKQMNATTTSILANFTKSLSDEILRVPSALLSGLTQLDSDFSLASNDLNRQIRAAQEQLAISRTDEEKSAVARGLAVLTKLKAVQDGVLDSDLITRTMIRNHSLDSIKTREAAVGAMASTMVAIEAVASSLDQDGHDIATTDSVSQTLSDQLSLVLEKVAGEASADTARDALVEANMLAQKLRRSRDREKIARNSTDIVNSLTRNHSSIMESELHMSEGIRGQLMASWNISSDGIDEAIEGVLQDTRRGKVSIASNSSYWRTDVLSRLAVTRQAVASFLSLLTELGQTQVSQLGRITVGNSEIVSAVDADIKSLLVASEARTNSTRGDSVDLWARLMALNSSQDDLKTEFQSDVDEIIPSLDAINRKANVDILKLDDLMDTAINAESEESTNMLNVIDHILETYSDMITSQSA